MSDGLPPKETLPALIRRALADSRDDVLVERDNGGWKSTSSTQLLARAEHLACAIRDAGLLAGDRVALIAHNCVDWVVVDFAAFFAGCVVVPIYPTQAADQTAFILRHSGTKLLFVDTLEGYDRLVALGIPLPTTVVFTGNNNRSLSAFEKRGQELFNADPQRVRTYESERSPDDLAVLIYTSGTTGNPKGVMLTHDNLAYDSQATLVYAVDVLDPGNTVLSVLPFSHIYEHTMIYIYLLSRVRYVISHDPNELLRDLLDTRPYFLTAVPRIFDRVLAGVMGNALKAGGLQAQLVPWALRSGREYMRAQNRGTPISFGMRLAFFFASSLVLSKIPARLGLDRIIGITSGSAKLHDDISFTFLAMGIPISQGYGLTETSPVITTNPLEKNRVGTVGYAIPGVEIKIAADGEILARGRNVMIGYYRDEEATNAAIIDGWFHTGDIGEIDADGYLRITDRKKEVFKTSTGKFVSPARVESALKRSVFIAQAMVVGDGRAFPIALICPNWDLVRVELALDAGLSGADLIHRDDVNAFLHEQVKRRTSDLASFEQIRHFVLIPTEFSVESGELSPSMKIKRRVVEDRYASQIDAVYDHASQTALRG